MWVAMREYFKQTLLALILAISSGCVVPGFLYDSYFNFMNFRVDPTLAGSAANIIDLDENETGLLTDGPIDLPVTIAKLDSPDIQKISITVTGSPSQLKKNQPSALQSGERRFIIEGSAGAVHEEKTPKLIAFAIDAGLSVDSDSRITTSVAEDGSFQIEVNSDEDVIFAGLTEEETAMSPFLMVKEDPVTGQFVVITTNSNNIDNTGQLNVDSAGFYYLTLSNASGTQDFIRRNLDGTELQVIKSGLVDPVNRINAPTQNAIVTLSDAGELDLTLPSSLPSLVKGEPLELEIVSLTTNLGSAYDTALAKIELMADNKGVLVSESGSNSLLNYVRTQSGLVISVISESRYDDVKMALSPDSSWLYVFYLHEGAHVLAKMDMSVTNIKTAWAGREMLTEILTDEVLTLEAADNGTTVFSVDNNGTAELYFFNATDGLVALNDPINDPNDYANPVISPDGTIIFACKMGDESNGQANQIVYLRPATDSGGTLNPLTTFVDHSSCDEAVGSMMVDANGFLHLFFKSADGTLPQHALVKGN